jgi:hypothetical protein
MNQPMTPPLQLALAGLAVLWPAFEPLVDELVAVALSAKMVMLPVSTATSQLDDRLADV